MFNQFIEQCVSHTKKKLPNFDFEKMFNQYFQPRTQVYFNNECFCSGFFISEIFNQAVEQSLNTHFVYDNTEKLFIGDELWAQEDFGPSIDTAIFEHLFTAEQLAETDFPYTKYSKDEYWPWIKMTCLHTQKELIVPLQCVTTRNIIWVQELYFHSLADSDFHIAENPTDALIKSLLKIIEHDVIMGYWYTNRTPQKIIFDKRTKSLEQFFEKTKPSSEFEPEFYYCENSFGINVIICLVRDTLLTQNAIVGVATEFDSLEAMYCAYLSVVKQYQSLRIEETLSFFNQPQREAIDHKFSNQKIVLAGLLPVLKFEKRRENVNFLLSQFKEQNMSCYTHNFTTRKAQELGLTMMKSYSPELLYLSTPQAPPLAHPRFKHYGNLIEVDDHPFAVSEHPIH